eukprot:GFUD01013322.1.p1 GENE.GFUD01013322.1~~GFUD01013322.1.p1  ORF type:complete len:1573 (-),score=223.90 GFUD01013322.1:73-4233(-)
MYGAPLYWATVYNQMDVARLLLSRGAKVEPNYSPLTTRLLISRGGKLEPNYYPLTQALMYCNGINLYECKQKWTEDQENDCSIYLRFCNIDLIELLLSYGADPDRPTYDLCIFLMENNEEVVRLLLKYGANVNRLCAGDMSPLKMTLLSREKNMFNILVEQPGISDNCSPSIFDSDTGCYSNVFYAVLWGVNTGEVDVLRQLLERGADPNLCLESCGNVVVGYAAMNSKSDETAFELLNLLLENGANVTTEAEYKWTHSDMLDGFPLLLGPLLSNFTQASKLLIEKGIQVELWRKQWKMYGALFHALWRDNCEVANMLVTRGHSLRPAVGQRSAIYYAHKCPSTFWLMLRQLTFINATDQISAMTVEIGDEVILTNLQDLESKVIVINWKTLSYFYYYLDRETIRMVRAGKKLEEFISMPVVAPYPHPFMLVADFRMLLLNKIAETPPDQSCQSGKECQTVPDVFLIIVEKMMDIFIASDFYAPVLESLHQNPSFLTLLDNRKYVFAIMMVIFIFFSLPLCNLAILIFKRRTTTEITYREQEKREVIQELSNQCRCNNVPDENPSSLNQMPLKNTMLPENGKVSSHKRLIFSILLYSCIGLVNVYIYQLTKKSIYLIVRKLMNNFTYQTSLWLILSFKILNTLVIEHQPGSPCAGDIFANVYNIKLSFWLTEEDINEMTSKHVEFNMLREHIGNNSESVQQLAKNLNILRENSKNNISQMRMWQHEAERVLTQMDFIRDSTGKDLTQLIDLTNKTQQKDPTLLWESEWLSQKSWKTPLYIDIIGKTISVLIHIVYIIIFRSLKIFSRLTEQAKSSSSYKIHLSLLILLSASLNISFKLACINVGESVAGNLFMRILLILVVTPSSVLLEWFVYRVIKLYIDWFINFFTSCVFAMKNEDLALLSLSEMYLSPEKLCQTHQLIAQATLPIKEMIENIYQHKVEVVPTGSVFEMYGKPLTAPALESNLNSDYDVMFAFKKEEFPVEIAMKNDEFLHVFVLSDSCRLLNSIKMMDESTRSLKLSAERTRQFMKHIVKNVSIFHKESTYKEKIVKTGWNVFAFLFNLPRIGKWTIQRTESSGPAANYLVRQGSPMFAQDWVNRLDCDILLSFELGHWPYSAREWGTRERQWPSPEVVGLVIDSGCQIVPKEDPMGDEFSWRLSFSRGELLLSTHVSSKARDAYMAVKLFWKNNLKVECPLLRSYHLKTLFYHFLEATDNRHLEMGEVKNIARDLLLFIQQSINDKTCKHYFIDTINLFDCLSTNDVLNTSEQITTCIRIIESSINRDSFLSSLLSRNSKTVLTITNCRDNNPFLYTFFVFIVLVLNMVAICGGAVVFITGILFVLSQVISFLYASLILIPSILILFVLHRSFIYLSKCRSSWDLLEASTAR